MDYLSSHTIQAHFVCAQNSRLSKTVFSSQNTKMTHFPPKNPSKHLCKRRSVGLAGERNWLVSGTLFFNTTLRLFSEHSRYIQDHVYAQVTWHELRLGLSMDSGHERAHFDERACGAGVSPSRITWLPVRAVERALLRFVVHLVVATRKAFYLARHCARTRQKVALRSGKL